MSPVTNSASVPGSGMAVGGTAKSPAKLSKISRLMSWARIRTVSTTTPPVLTVAANGNVLRVVAKTGAPASKPSTIVFGPVVTMSMNMLPKKKVPPALSSIVMISVVPGSKMEDRESIPPVPPAPYEFLTESLSH